MFKIIKYIENNYKFYLLIALTLAYHFVSSEAFLVGVAIIFCFFLLLDFIQNKKIPINKLFIITIPLILYLILGGVMGIPYLKAYGAHGYIRDIFYHSNTLAVILLAISYFSTGLKKEQLFWAILIVGTIMGLYTLKQIIDYKANNPEDKIDYMTLRNISNAGYLVNFIAPISFLFIKRFKLLTIILSLFNACMAFISFSRAGFILLALIIAFMFMYYFLFTKYKKETIVVATIGFACLSVLMNIEYFKNIVSRFDKTFNELNPFQDFTDVNNVYTSWRAYEVYLISGTFKASKLTNKIFGNGFGSFIHSDIGIWYDNEMNYDIPIFHNGYFGAIFKGGIVGFALYVAYIIIMYYMSFKYIKDKKDLLLNLSFVSYIALASYVVMGIYHKEVWFILIFSSIYLIKYNKNLDNKTYNTNPIFVDDYELKSLKRIIKSFLAPVRRIGLKNKSFSIICNNCWAGHYYDNYNLKYLTPTIGLVIPPKSYIKLINNLNYYLNLELKEVKANSLSCYEMLKRKDEKALLRKVDDLICGKLDDVEIIFLHYDSFSSAARKWAKRKKRINYNNLIYKFNDQNELDELDFIAFDKFEAKNKLFFTSNKKYKDYNFSYYDKKYSNLGYILDDLHTSFNFKKYVNNIGEEK